MNYRHSYHAGNFADVFKHVLVLEIIQYLLQKPKPICYLDSHAGRGLYDLQGEAAGKTAEAALGIGRLADAKNLPEDIARYLQIIDSINLQRGVQSRRFYPGSPLLVKQLLRPEDRMILNELHPEEHQLLKQLFATDEQVTVHAMDAYQSLKAHLPPFARRGLVLIDPAFEVKDEWQRVEQGLQAALTRWATGIYAIWYPIKDKAVVERFAKTIKAMAQGKYLRAEIQPYADDFAFGLKACGMIVINPPWQLAEQLQTSMPVLWQYLSPHQQGHYRVEGPTC